MGKIKLVTVILWLSIIGFTAGSVSAQQDVILPITGGVYHMITSPVVPQDPDPQASLGDDLGPYDEIQWRLFRYDPAQTQYVELKSPDWSQEQDFDFGRGYWIISRNPTDIDIQGDPTVVNFIILKGDGDGWNQIGNIYLQDFTIIDELGNCNLTVAAAVGGPIYQLNAANNPYTHITLKEYAGGLSYTDIGDEPGEVLEKGKGYWLRNISGQDVILSFLPGGLTSVTTANSPNVPGQAFFERVAQQEDPPDPPPGFTSSFSSGSSSGSVGCFIATAAYLDNDHPNVRRLREFRDRYLLANSFGRMFVDMYYRYSPNLAKFLANRRSMKALARINLMPIIGLSSLVIKMNVYGFFIVLAFPVLMGFFLCKESGGGGGTCERICSIKSEGGERKR